MFWDPSPAERTTKAFFAATVVIRISCDPSVCYWDNPPKKGASLQEGREPRHVWVACRTPGLTGTAHVLTTSSESPLLSNPSGFLSLRPQEF